MLVSNKCCFFFVFEVWGGRGGQGQLSSSEAGFPDPGNFAAPDCDYQKRDIGSIKTWV